MLYVPTHFQVDDLDAIRGIVNTFNFATMVSVSATEPHVSHLPFLSNIQAIDRGVLHAHMARANPHWKVFADGMEVLVIFNGPHAFISPRWYAPDPLNVPTWNYAVVHVSGVPRIVEDQAEAYGLMRQLVTTHDRDWPLELSGEGRSGLMRGIVVFEVEIHKVTAKFKLSQNRSAADQIVVSKELLASTIEVERQTGELMMTLGRRDQK